MNPTTALEASGPGGLGSPLAGQFLPTLLIPGYPQWSWRQRERAIVLIGSYLTSIFVGVLAWGTSLGLLILLFAFLVHVFSAADAIRQSSFPGFGRFVPGISTTAGLGAFCYGPALALASAYAWPISPDERPREGFFVNRWAYQMELPTPGQTVWLRPTRGARPSVARIVAGPTQRLEWLGAELRINGQVVNESPFGLAGLPTGLRMTIPTDHVLVTFGAEPRRGQGIPGGWELVDLDEIQGRAWARSYPFWDRQLLR